MPAVVGVPPVARAVRPMLARVVSLERDTPELAAAYDHVGARQLEHGKTLIALLQPRGGDRVLDIGCGTGLLADWVAARVVPGGGRVVGIDPLPLRVELAARRHMRFEARVGHAEDLSAFGDASFDLAYLNNTFHWLADAPRALAEALRVLAPGGRIGLNSPEAERVHQAQLLMRESMAELGLPGPPLLPAARATPAELLRAAGFTNIEVAMHTVRDEIRDADDVLASYRSTGQGDHLADLGPGQLTRLRERLECKLDLLRTARGLTLERYLVFATATKPG